MDNENSVNALFVEPNAYALNCVKPERKTQKIVFQEPYESLPNFFINNDFKKKDCKCVPCEKKKENHQKPPCGHEKPQSCNSNGFNIQNILPLFGLLGAGNGGIDFSKLTSILNSGKIGGEEGGLMPLITSLMSNKDLFSNIFKSFTGSKSNSSKSNKQQIKSTDFEIKNYTRVN